MKTFLIAAPLVLAAAVAVGTPASAAPWISAGQIRSEIAQLDRQVDRLHDRRLENQVDRLQALYRGYARGGFTRGELQRLDSQLSAVRAQVYARSRDGRLGGYGDNSRYGAQGGHDRYDRR